jgi:hypothetical protein
MTEYSTASPHYPGNHGMNRLHPEFADTGLTRIQPFASTCRAVRSSIEQFQAALDANHEAAMCLVSGNSSVEFRAEAIRFSPADVITFYGYSDSGEKIQLVQHVSQVSLLLKSVTKRDAQPLRVAFIYGEA